MNYRMIWLILSRTLGCEAALMCLPLAVALIERESPWPFVITIGIIAVCAFVLALFKPRDETIYAREGFVSVALSWIALSLFGALPFVISGQIPSYVDAVFETVSGFTTTGASILTDVEAMGKGLLFWRSFTHWIGGMGVLVFVLAVLPLSEERSMHIMRAEVPGPTVGKLVPRVRKTAIILYVIYVAMTFVEVILLLCGGMPLFDSLIHSFGTAGTGGFSSRALSVGGYDSAYIDVVISTFMLLFSVNFNLYYLLLIRDFRSVFRNEELRWFVAIVAFAVLTIALNLGGAYGDFLEALRYSYFQVSSVISTTGYSTANFDLWPEYSRWILVLLMFVGACAGSTGGGLKVSRVLILFKSASAELRRSLRPRSVNRVRLDGTAVDSRTIHATLVFFLLYIAIAFAAVTIVSLDGFDFTTNFTGVMACLSNIGPGLSIVGPYGSFAPFSVLSKLVLSVCMLLGRLEILPILMLISPRTWKKS